LLKGISLMIAILGDLDTRAWVMSGLALALCSGMLGMDFYYLRLKLPVRSRSAWILLGTFAFFCAGAIYETISNASDAQRKIETGPTSKVHEIYLGHNRSLYLAQVLDHSGTSRLLNFSSDAFAVLKERATDRAYLIGYLDDPNEFYENGRQGFYFTVVDIGDPETNASYYHFDTTHHPVRAAVYLGDTVILLLTALIVSRMADASPDTEDDFENYREQGDDRDRKDTSITELNLNAPEVKDQ
jgi:hypothetical protein